MDQTCLKGFALLVFLQVNGQVSEFRDHLKFQYGIAPSIGKHQMETYEYIFGKNTALFGINSSIQVKYLNSRFTFFEVTEVLSTEYYERLHRLDVNFGGAKNIANGWAMIFSFNPQLASNFSSGVSSEDGILGLRTGIVKSWGNSSLTMGIERATNLGEPRWLPYFSYNHTISMSLHFQLGFPHSYFEYSMDDRHKVSAHGMANGSQYNITGDSSFTEFGELSNTKLSFSTLNFSLEHRFKIQPNITTVTQIGLLANNDFKVENNRGEPLFNFDTNESIYFSMGLQFNLNHDNNE